MNPPLEVRTVTAADRQPCAADRRTAKAFRRRRAYLVRASARGRSPPPRAPLVGCGVPPVRRVLAAVQTTGLAGLSTPVTRPTLVEAPRPPAARRQPLLPPSPRPAGQPLEPEA